MKVLKELLYYLDVSLAYMKMALLSVIEYPSAVLGWLLSNPIQFIVGFAAIKFVVAEFGSINGWPYGQLAFLYGLAVISHALSMIFFVQGWFLGYYVLDGEFDRFLTRPLSVVYQFLFTQVNVFGFTDLIPGVIVFLYGCFQVSFSPSLSHIGMILLMLAGATLIRSGIYVMLGSTSFWTRSANDFGQYTQEIFDKTTMYPLSMYPESLQFILTFIIPIGWVCFYPVSGMLGVDNTRLPGLSSWTAVWITVGVGILVMLAASTVFRLGLKKYESAGN